MDLGDGLPGFHPGSVAGVRLPLEGRIDLGKHDFRRFQAGDNTGLARHDRRLPPRIGGNEGQRGAVPFVAEVLFEQPLDQIAKVLLNGVIPLDLMKLFSQGRFLQLGGPGVFDYAEA